MIPYLRLYDSSIFNYLRYEVIPLHFSERVTNDSLVQVEDSNTYALDSTMEPSPVSYGRGFVLFDESTVNGRQVADTSAEQTSTITVNGASSYTIDYVGGRILNPNTPPTSITYKWYYVSVMQGWPGTTPPPLPCVALTMDSTQKSPFQLGGGTKDTIKATLHVFATSEAEKKDITDVLYQALYCRSIPIRNWHQGSYLDYDGSFTGFAPTTVSGLSGGYFKDVKTSLTDSRTSWSELNRYRSKIDFVFEVYKD